MTDTLRILSFDPGLSTMGWAFSTYELKTGMLNVQKFGDIHGTKVACKDKTRVEEFGQRLITLDIIEREVINLMETYKPNLIGSEAAFYHPQRPAAYVALILCIHTIERLLFYKYGMKLNTFSPRTVKVTASGTGKSDKDEIQNALLNHPSIRFKQSKTNPTEKMSQHAADAVAVGYTTAVQYPLNLVQPAA